MACFQLMPVRHHTALCYVYNYFYVIAYCCATGPEKCGYGHRNAPPLPGTCVQPGRPSGKALSPFLIGRMFLREPSWKYSAKLFGS